MLGTSTNQRATAEPQVAWSTIGVVAGAAAVCASVTWVALVAFGDVALEVTQAGSTRDVGLVAVILTSAIVALCGGALLRWWQGRSAVATQRWTLLAAVVAVVSLVGPTSGATLSATTSLMCLHGVVAAVVIVALRRASDV